LRLSGYAAKPQRQKFIFNSFRSHRVYTEQLTERMGIGAGVPPQAVNNAAVTSGSVDMQKFHRAMFLLEVGTVSSGGLLNVQLVEDVNANLANATNLAGSNVSLVNLNTSNKQYTFEVRADQMSKRYIGLQVTETAGHAITLNVVGFGDEANHKPGKAANDSSVVTQNVVS
jgi:hypothetical protein